MKSLSDTYDQVDEAKNINWSVIAKLQQQADKATKDKDYDAYMTAMEKINNMTGYKDYS